MSKEIEQDGFITRCEDLKRSKSENDEYFYSSKHDSIPLATKISGRKYFIIFHKNESGYIDWFKVERN